MTKKIHWAFPSNDITLPGDKTHVWRIPLDLPSAEVKNLRKILSNDELNRADRFHFEKHRNRFISARGFLRMILGLYLNESGAGLRFEYGTHGKPNLPGNPVFFNLSHSHYMAVLGIYQHGPLGIDIEWVHRKIELLNIAKRFFAPGEYNELAKLPGEKQRDGFFNCWTRKEAYIKADGAGLQIPLHQFEVTLKPGEPVFLKSSLHNPENVNRWKIVSFDVDQDYRAALVVEKNENGQQYFDAQFLAGIS